LPDAPGRLLVEVLAGNLARCGLDARVIELAKVADEIIQDATVDACQLRIRLAHLIPDLLADRKMNSPHDLRWRNVSRIHPLMKRAIRHRQQPREVLSRRWPFVEALSARFPRALELEDFRDRHASRCDVASEFGR